MSSGGAADHLVVAALGGNALVRPGQPVTAAEQRAAVARTAATLARVATHRRLVVSHGNGPQVGMLAQDGGRPDAYPLDVLDAETEGMIGYLIQQELTNALGGKTVATLLTQVEVDADDPAFDHPVKPVGPAYGAAEAGRLAAEKGWHMAGEGETRRRLVPSPRPRRVLEAGAVRLLVEAGATVVCAGGGGIPVVRDTDGHLRGVEAVVDKDRVTALLAQGLGAGLLLLLTDVDAVWEGWDSDAGRAIRAAGPGAMRAMALDAGSMGPKVEAACAFTEATGAPALIGALEAADAVLAGEAGTRIQAGTGAARYW